MEDEDDDDSDGSDDEDNSSDDDDDDGESSTDDMLHIDENKDGHEVKSVLIVSVSFSLIIQWAACR